MTNKKRTFTLLLTAGVLCGGIWMWRGHTARASVRPYSARGFGGFVGRVKPQPASTDPVVPIEAAYNAGRFSEAERLAAGVIAAREQASDPNRRREAARALWVAAYAAARRGDFGLARVRFSALRDQAAQLPDHGSLSAPPGRGQRDAAGSVAGPTPETYLPTQYTGEVLPTLEEEGAFQAAICTGALGDKGGAEREMKEFLGRYPQSILIHAAVKRIGRMHGGDVPKDAEKLWQAAKAVQAKQEEAVRRAEAMCGPECLAELVRRKQGRSAGVPALANAMATSGEGTTLANLAAASRRQGIALRGVDLTTEGLAEQKLPVVALIAPGHYVLVETVAKDRIGVWDPDAEGTGHSGRREFKAADWQRVWTGMTLVE